MQNSSTFLNNINPRTLAIEKKITREIFHPLGRNKYDSYFDGDVPVRFVRIHHVAVHCWEQQHHYSELVAR